MTEQLQMGLPAKLEPLMKPCRYKAVHGGRGSGKSHGFVEMLLLACLGKLEGFENKRVRAICLREVQNTLQDSVFQLCCDKIAKYGLDDLFKPIEGRIYGPNESLIVFRGMQSYNATNIKSLEDFNIAFVEEAQDFSQTSLDLLRPTIRAEGSELWFAWNPRYEDDAVDLFFRGDRRPTNSIVIELNWRDNPFLPDVLYQELCDDFLKDPAKAEHIWNGAYQVIVEGAYYARQLRLAEEEGRICDVPHRPEYPVHVAWDLGIGDDTSLIMAQRIGGYIHVIDHYANNGQPASHYVEWLMNRMDKEGRKYLLSSNILPHDAESREWTHGLKRIQVLRQLGLPGIKVNPRIPVDDGIEAVRNVLPIMRFDRERCKGLLKALRQYRRAYDEDRRMFKDSPLHDWTSHDADAMRALALGLEPESAPIRVPRYSQARRNRIYHKGGPSPWTA